jgi:hypothetical protein
MTEPLARIEAALEGLGAEHEPPVGWQSRVLAATAPRKSPKWWWFAAPAVAAAVVVIVVLYQPDEHGLELALTFDQGNVVVRGDPSLHHAGNLMHATATRDGPFYAVWIYRDDVLVMACPGAMQCRVTSKTITADTTLTLGTYTIVALRSDAPLPTPKGRFDADLARATEAGATMIPKRLTVR